MEKNTKAKVGWKPYAILLLSAGMIGVSVASLQDADLDFFTDLDTSDFLPQTNDNVALPAIQPDSDSVDDIMLADEDDVIIETADTRQAALDAMSRLGYVPEGFDPATVAAEVKHNDYFLASLEGIEFLSASVFTKDDALFEISGIQDVPSKALCQGTGGEIFACADWVAEGVAAVTSAARDFRCEASSGRDGFEVGAELVNCEMNIGGDWFDYASWSVGSGYALPGGNDDYAGLHEKAVAAPYGIWRAGFNVPDVEVAPERNRFSFAVNPDMTEAFLEVSGQPR